MEECREVGDGIMKRGGKYFNKNANNILDAQAMAVCYMRYVDSGKPINKKDKNVVKVVKG